MKLGKYLNIYLSVVYIWHIPIWSQVITFYNGIEVATRNMIDIVTRGALLGRIQKDIFNLLEEMNKNDCQWPNERLNL